MNIMFNMYLSEVIVAQVHRWFQLIVWFSDCSNGGRGKGLVNNQQLSWHFNISELESDWSVPGPNFKISLPLISIEIEIWLPNVALIPSHINTDAAWNEAMDPC